MRAHIRFYIETQSQQHKAKRKKTGLIDFEAIATVILLEQVEAAASDLTAPHCFCFLLKFSLCLLGWGWHALSFKITLGS